MKRGTPHHVVVVRDGVYVDLSCVCGWTSRQFVGRGRTPTSRQAFDLHVNALVRAAS